MAIQAGKTKLLGRVGDTIYYKMNGKYYARAVSSLSGRRVKRDPKFKRTMEFANLFGRASKLASAVHRSLPPERRNYQLLRKMTGQANQMLKQGIDEITIETALQRMAWRSKKYISRKEKNRTEPAAIQTVKPSGIQCDKLPHLACSPGIPIENLPHPDRIQEYPGSPASTRPIDPIPLFLPTLFYQIPHPMKKILWLIACCYSSQTYSQFAFVSDKDGKVNIRSTPDLSDNIEDSLENGHLVYCMEDRGSWVNIDYIKNGALSNGYVYKNRLVRVDNYEKIPVQRIEPARIIFLKDSVHITISSKPFDRHEHKLFYSTEHPEILELVNGKLPFGTDGNIPRSAYHSIEIRTGNRSIQLPVSAYDDLFEPTLGNTNVHYDRKRDTLYLQSLNGDGAGGYFVIWRFVKGQYKDRFIAHGF